MIQVTHNDTVEVKTTIAAAAADGLSETLNLGTARLWAIQMPAAWTAAQLTLRASSDGVTFANVYMNGAEYAIDVAASRFIVLPPDLLGIQFLQLRSGTAATPVQQAGDRAMKLVCLTRML